MYHTLYPYYTYLLDSYICRSESRPLLLFGELTIYDSCMPANPVFLQSLDPRQVLDLVPRTGSQLTPFPGSESSIVSFRLPLST
jgi:hypothetical protein